jgi:uncharacterized protein
MTGTFSWLGNQMTETMLSVVKNTNRIFESSSYLKVIDSINDYINSNTSIIVLTGESRTGKTLLARKIIKDLQLEYYVVFFKNPHITIEEMLSLACSQIGVDSSDPQNKLDKKKIAEIFFKYLDDRSKEKGPVKIFIDDAQEINISTLSIILKFMKWQSGTERVLQLILIGLPQLKTLLASLELPELENANPVYLCLEPLNTEEVGAFIVQRLNTLGIKQNGFFSPEAVKRIELYTQGTPGLVGVLVDSVLAIISSNECSSITEEIVDEAVDFFSIPWAMEIKNPSTIQLTRNQEEVEHDKTTQVLSNREGEEIDKTTLLSIISRKVADLFSRKKLVNDGSANDYHGGKVNIEFEEKAPLVLVEELRYLDNNMEGGKVSHGAQSLGTSVKTEEIQSVNKKAESTSRISLQQNKRIDTMNVQEETMNRAERLNKELKALQNESPDVEAVALISEDGLVVASALPQDLDEIRVGGMSATLLSLGTRSSAELRRGKVEEIIVRGEQGYTVMLNAGQGTLLLVVANQNAKLGLILFDMRESIEKIVDIL